MIIKDKFEDYKANKNFVNPSSFKGEKISTPAEFEYNFYNGVNIETTSMKFGTAFHCLILTPELFESEYHITKEEDFSGKRNADGNPSMSDKLNKSQYELLCLQNPDKIILFPAESELLSNMRKGLDRFLFPEWKYIVNLAKGKTEQSIYMEAKFDNKFNFIEFVEPNFEQPLYYADGEFHYLKVKTRSDYFHSHKSFGADLKTCRSADPNEFSKDMYEYGYHVQAPFTLDILNANLKTQSLNPESEVLHKTGYTVFYFLAVENKPPFQAIIFQLAQEAMSKGREIYQNRLAYICEGFALGKWNGYEIYSDQVTKSEDGVLLTNRKVIEIDLPRWAYMKEETKFKHFRPF